MAMLNKRRNSRFTESYEFYSSDFTRFSGSIVLTESKSNVNYDAILDSLEDLHQIPGIFREGISLTGGAVAILLQAAARGTPATDANARATAELSEELYRNLRTTVIYLQGLTFGTRDQRRHILERTHSQKQRQQPQQDNQKPRANIHDQYTHDPKLRLWIAATLYATTTEVYQRVVERLSLERAERTYYEFSVLAKALDLPKDSWPQNRNAFWVYWDENVELLDVDSSARPLADGLRNLQDLPAWLKVSKSFISNITPEMLPPHVREQYGFQSSITSRFKYRLYMGGAKAIYPVLPSAIRCMPMKRAMREVEEMLQEN
ncbi:uncharacterized protein TRUGW13939_04066 [Talaromyces rugulosus]|uniref:ER-bound oxygenase mpaB/mpaB'/Rubber oxygenase catalytic domain-containing protein n=1 Tax=Talaromyces rugulosus TaxID=121627 RepID=A0A7H8QT39_TALRU|nr:uncharacterized protein TRUGW13939_04066 [Talaromyces rugulosus]QKX56958.1 hypothetical protein TRUGW13939_04066 [Talaromyces rugulosus]